MLKIDQDALRGFRLVRTEYQCEKMNEVIVAAEHLYSLRAEYYGDALTWLINDRLKDIYDWSDWAGQVANVANQYMMNSDSLNEETKGNIREAIWKLTQAAEIMDRADGGTHPSPLALRWNIAVNGHSYHSNYPLPGSDDSWRKYQYS